MLYQEVLQRQLWCYSRIVHCNSKFIFGVEFAFYKIKMTWTRATFTNTRRIQVVNEMSLFLGPSFAVFYYEILYERFYLSHSLFLSYNICLTNKPPQIKQTSFA